MTPGSKFFNYLLKLERESVNTFIGNRVWKTNQNNIFGGELVAQAMIAAHANAPEKSTIHSIHSRFLQKSNNELPIKYNVKTLISGGTFHIAEVFGIQNDSACFHLTASFKSSDVDTLQLRYSLNQLVSQPISKPQDLPTIEETLTSAKNKSIKLSDGDLLLASIYQKWSKGTPCELRICLNSQTQDKAITHGWIRIRDSPSQLEPYQRQASLAYLSDFGILVPIFVKNPTFQLGQIASLDHAIWFHDSNAHSLQPHQWIFFQFESFFAGNGLTSNMGHAFNEDGEHLATVIQQGLFRPKKDKGNVNNVDKQKPFMP